MSRIVVISGTTGQRRIDYSTLSAVDIDKRVKAYQTQYGSFRKFLHSYDCESSPPEDYVTLVDWESLLAEQKARKQRKDQPSAHTWKQKKAK